MRFVETVPHLWQRGMFRSLCIVKPFTFNILIFI